mmetsp:Transcript_6145/g.8999  ORF Transcript_6145/g.8999 Transcript_6145/m.8999 type:complete len:290 (+) Transcript_6145:159-1028(+)
MSNDFRDYEVVLALPSGIEEHQLSVDCKRGNDRQPLSTENEDVIETIWKQRLTTNASLFNGTKFRFAGLTNNSTSGHTLSLGITDYKSFLGTNCAPHWQKLAPVHLASPLGNAAVVETSDQQIVLLQRSASVGEMPNTLVMPGGHPEPEMVNVKTMADWNNSTCIYENDEWNLRVRHELWDAMLREVVEETGIPLTELDNALCIGFSRRVQNYRPDIVFFIPCRLSSTRVKEMYSAGPEHQSESTALITMDRIRFVKEVIDENSINMPGCHRGGVDLYRRYLMHLGVSF